MWQSLATVFIVCVAAVGLVLGIAALWAKSRYQEGKAEVEKNRLEEGAKKRKEAEDAESDEKSRLEDEYL
jgi:hypothetical protein